MKLIIGGAYQGKLDYAKKEFNVYDGWIDGRECKREEISDCRGIHHFHEYVKRMLVCEQDNLTALEQQAKEFSSWLLQNNPELVIVSNELGYGIVPMEKKDRLWREMVGRVCTCLAAEADEVVRVVCGIGTRLK